GPGWRDWAGPAEPHPPGLGYVDLPGLAAQPPNLAWSQAHNPKPVVLPCFAPGGLAVGAGEVVRHGLGEVSQRLLLDHRAACGQPLVLVPRRRKLTAVFYPAWRGLAAGPPPRLLLDGEIPYKPGMRAMIP